MTSQTTHAIEPVTDLPAEERRRRIREAFDRNHSQMTVVLARQLGVPEEEVIRAMPPLMVTELDVSRWEPMIRDFESLGMVHVIATNASATLEVFGQFGNFSTWGEYFNVQTRTLDMHIRGSTLASAFAVIKPGHMDGVRTLSFQFFNHLGQAAFKVFLTFGGQAPSAECEAKFEAIRERYRR